MPQADRLVRRALDRGLRAEIAGPEQGSLGARIRAHRLVPYQAVIGAEEAAADEVALRLRDGRRLPALPAAEALARIGAHDRRPPHRAVGGHRARRQAQRHPEFHPGSGPVSSGILVSRRPVSRHSGIASVASPELSW